MKVLKHEALTPILTLNWSKFIKSPCGATIAPHPPLLKGDFCTNFMLYSVRNAPSFEKRRVGEDLVNMQNIHMFDFYEIIVW